MARGLIGLYWRARRQSLDECAALALRTLVAMRDAGFDGFFETGRSRADALRRPVEVTVERIKELLGRSVDPHDVLADMGFSLFLWSGRPENEAFTLSIHCGSYAEFVGNNVTLELPADGPHSLAHTQVAAEALFDVLVQLWQPEQAILCADDDLRWEEGRIPADVPAVRRFSAI